MWGHCNKERKDLLPRMCILWRAQWGHKIYVVMCGVRCRTYRITTGMIPPRSVDIPLRSFKSNHSAMFLLTWLRHFNEATQFTCLSTYCFIVVFLMQIYHLIILQVKSFQQVVDLTRSQEFLYRQNNILIFSEFIAYNSTYQKNAEKTFFQQFISCSLT